MAEISFSVSMQVQKDFLSQAFQASGVTASMSSTGLLTSTLNLGTATTAVVTTSLSSVGMCFAKSLATVSTHTVSFGRLVGTNLYSSCTLKAGEAALLRLTAGDYAAQAAVANSKLLITIVEG